MMDQYFLKLGGNQLSKVVFVIGLLLLLGVSQARAESHPAEIAWPTLPATPLYFIENRGQLDPQVRYYLQGRDKTLYFTSTGVTLALTRDAPERWVIKLDFVGGRARPMGQAQTETVVSYFKGPADQWQTGLPTYARLVYPDLWPGIDLVYTLVDNQLKYQFTIRPGADPARIRLAYHGATAVRLVASGQLQVSTPAGSFHDAAPSAYQVVKGRRAPVSVAYTLAASTAGGVFEYGFRLGAYDPASFLVLDPALILYAGFIGGSNREVGASVAVDAAGNAYVAGETNSISDFPAVVGPDLTHNGGPYNGDAFIAKVRSDGAGLVYAGFIGGSDEDSGAGVAVDAAGNAYVTGRTASNNFPVTPGVYDPTYNGGGDVFVAKVNAGGTGLAYATYIGDVVSDIPNESGKDIEVDGAGNAYVLFDSNYGPYGGYDTLMVKLNAAGSALTNMTFIGGYNGDDKGDSLTLDAGNVYVTGQTNSDDFHTTPGAYDETYNGGGDAFVVKVKPDGSVGYATYIGNTAVFTANDHGAGIAVDGSDHAYVLVNTSHGPFGSYDASVVKLNAAGSGLLYRKYIGGSDLDFGSGLALDSQGRVYLSGDTTSVNFPVVNWPTTSYDAPQETFAALLKADGSELIYAGFIAGRGTGSGAIAVDSSGNAYVTGTNWRGEDFPAVIGPDVSANGERDAFVVKISPLLEFTYLPFILK